MSIRLRTALFLLALALVASPGIPLKPLLALTLLNLSLRETYPFSHFPMYASFGRKTYYLYVSDENDRVLFTSKFFKQSSAKLRKTLMTELALRKMTYSKATSQQLQEVAEATLRTLTGSLSDDSVCHLKLYLVNLVIENGRIQEKNSLIGELAKPW